MSTDTRPEVTRFEVAIVAGYLLFAVARQIAHDVRTLARWARAVG